MTVRIYLDLDKLHLVVQGQRHRAALPRVPKPGEQVTMLCGLTDLVEYTTTPVGPVMTCWLCDLHYRRRLGFSVLPTHPGIELSRPPSRKRPYTN